MDLLSERKIQQIGSSKNMSISTRSILQNIYRVNKLTPKGVLKYKAKSKRVNPLCYSPPKRKKFRRSEQVMNKKSLSRKRMKKLKHMKELYKSFKNLNIPKLKHNHKTKRVKFEIPTGDGIPYLLK